MRRDQTAFLIFILCLTVGMMEAFSVFRYHFSGIEGLKREVGDLKKELRGQQMKTEQAKYELRELAQNVAFMLPEKKSSQYENYQLRNIASLVQTPISEAPLFSQKPLLQKAKNLFSHGKYEEALILLKDLYKSDEGGVYSIEIRYFLTESYFLTKRYAESLKIIDELVQLFPDHDLTGYSLLRLGQIFDYQNREDEAYEIFQMVKQKFSIPELKSQAEILSKRVRKS